MSFTKVLEARTLPSFAVCSHWEPLCGWHVSSGLAPQWSPSRKKVTIPI